tara:strand:- start:263 stop:418 length:156 start_codon:yes stop_codon:yes gene_type:complete
LAGDLSQFFLLMQLLTFNLKLATLKVAFLTVKAGPLIFDYHFLKVSFERGS